MLDDISCFTERQASYIVKNVVLSCTFFSIPPSGPPPRISATNKGAQLLAKMGWQGGGLGAERQVTCVHMFGSRDIQICSSRSKLSTFIRASKSR